MAKLLEFFREARAALAALSPITRVILVAYAVSVPLHWTLRYAPGATFVELEEAAYIELPIVGVTFAEPWGERALVANVGAPRWWVLDWTRSDELTEALVDIRSDEIDLAWAPHQVLFRDGRLDLLAWEDGKHLHHRYAGGPAPETRPVARDALWLAPSGDVVGATEVYARAKEKLGHEPFWDALWHVGRFVIARAAEERFVSEGERYVQKRVAADTDFLVFEAQTGEPVARIETLGISAVEKPPRYEGLLYATGSWLAYVACDDRGCRGDDVDLRVGRGDVLAATHDPWSDRIAVCTGTSLLLYAGAPGDEDILYLGEGALEGPCNAIWIASARTVLVGFEDGSYAVARFREAT